MNKELPIINSIDFKRYEKKFKALSDEKRLHIINILAEKGTVCVCDLEPMTGMPQSKLSYHLKILLDAELIQKQTRGTWNDYTLNVEEVRALLSDQLCCVFLPPEK